MIGQHDRSESLSYYFRIEDQVPENHLYVSSTATLVSFLCMTSRVHPTAKRGDRRLIRKCCCGILLLGYLCLAVAYVVVRHFTPLIRSDFEIHSRLQIRTETTEQLFIVSAHSLVPLLQGSSMCWKGLCPSAVPVLVEGLEAHTPASLWAYPSPPRVVIIQPWYARTLLNWRF
jgi:hypothetical protein